MNTTQQQWLRLTDPLNDDPGLPPEAAQEIRRAVVGAVQSTRPPFVSSQALAVAVAVVVMLAAGVLAGRQLPERRNGATAAPMPGGGLEPRQFQFATPGGTRIIWVFDPEFTLKETIP